MKLVDLCWSVLEGRYRSRPTVESVRSEIKQASRGGGIAFYPCSRYANSLIQQIQEQEPSLASRVVCFFDESPLAVTACGLPVRPLADLSRVGRDIDVVVIAASTFIAPYTERLQEAGYGGSIVTTSYFDSSLPECSLEELRQKFYQTYDLMADRKARMAYLVTWLSRVLNESELTYLFESEEERPATTSKTLHYKGYRLEGLSEETIKELYAEPYCMRYVSPQPGDVVLDVGAFKGDSAAFFADRVGNTGRIYAFEPTKTNFQALVENIRRNALESVVCPVQKGIGSQSGRAKSTVIETGAPWSYLSDDQGSEDVEITTIDEFVETEKIKEVSFIKVDAEGWDHAVLAGAAKTIATHRPRMAIAAYHHTRDLIELPLLVDALGSYDLFIRAKLEGPFGTTLFCAPRS